MTTSNPSFDTQYRLWFDAVPIPMWVFDLETLGFLAVNDAAVQHYGYSRDEFLRMTIRDIRPPDEVPRLLDALDRPADPHSEPEIWRHQRKDGTLIDVQIHRHLLDWNGRSAGLVVAQDVTRQCQAEHEREHYQTQLQQLAHAAVSINQIASLDETLGVITDLAREIIGAHQAGTSLTIDSNWSQSITAISLSDKYAAWRDYDEAPTGTGIYRLVCQHNQSMRLTQAELEAHPGWRRFSDAADRHPPLCGWLAAPMIGLHGENIGLIQLSDKYDGDFTESDEAVLVQLAQMASVAVENARLLGELKRQTRTMRDLARQLISAQEAERKRIARELHDEMGQELLVLKLDLSMISDHLPPDMQTLAAQVQESMQLVDHITDQIRTLSLDLRPSLLDDLGLLVTLEWYGRRFQQRTGILIRLALPQLDNRLPGEIETTVFRCMQEALTNIARHAAAREVQIQMTCDEGQGLRLTIRDNGNGFDASALDTQQAVGSSGLSGMRERLSLIGGRLSIESVVGQGTALHIDIPLMADAAENS